MLCPIVVRQRCFTTSTQIKLPASKIEPRPHRAKSCSKIFPRSHPGTEVAGKQRCGIGHEWPERGLDHVFRNDLYPIVVFVTYRRNRKLFRNAIPRLNALLSNRDQSVYHEFTQSEDLPRNEFQTVSARSFACSSPTELPIRLTSRSEPCTVGERYASLLLGL